MKESRILYIYIYIHTSLLLYFRDSRAGVMSGSFGVFMLALEIVSGISWGRYGSRILDVTAWRFMGLSHYVVDM